MTNQEKKIRRDWFEFRRGQSRNNTERIYLSKDQINSVFSKMFK